MAGNVVSTKFRCVNTGLVVDFEAVFLHPSGTEAAESETGKTAVLIYFPGKDSSRGGLPVQLQAIRAVITEPVLLVAPLRKKGWTKWWVLQSDDDEGRLYSPVDQTKVTLFAEWIKYLTRGSWVDPQRLCLAGFEAGAFAVTELLVSGQLPPVHSAVLAALHGHGSADPQTASERHPRRRRVLEGNWAAHLERLERFPCLPGGVRAFPGPRDPNFLVSDMNEILLRIARKQNRDSFRMGKCPGPGDRSDYNSESFPTFRELWEQILAVVRPASPSCKQDRPAERQGQILRPRPEDWCKSEHDDEPPKHKLRQGEIKKEEEDEEDDEKEHQHDDDEHDDDNSEEHRRTCTYEVGVKRGVDMGALLDSQGAEENDWPCPLWPPEPNTSRTLYWIDPISKERIEFEVEVVLPTDWEHDIGEKLDMYVGFCGAASNGGIRGISANYAREALLQPVLFVAPKKGKMTHQHWVLKGNHREGWRYDDFDEQTASLYGRWVTVLSMLRCIDSTSLLGFSAGAYAATEVWAQCLVPLKWLVLCALHPHGDVEGCDERATANWKAHRRRLHFGPELHGVVWLHNSKDTVTRRCDAEPVFEAIKVCQAWCPSRKSLLNQHPASRFKEQNFSYLEVPYEYSKNSKAKRTYHFYFEAALAMDSLWDKLQGD